MSKLERELHDKEKECTKLKTKLMGEKSTIDVREASSADAFASFNADSEDSELDQHGFLSSTKKENVYAEQRFRSPAKGMDPPDNGNFSPSKRSMQMPVLSPNTASTKSSQSNDVIPHSDTMSTASADLGNPSGWFADFGDSSTIDSTDHQGASFSGILSEPGAGGQSRRAIERDALRKYVRKRYLKSKTTNL